MQLPFGFEIRKSAEDNISFVPPNNDDGALERIASSGAGFFGQNFTGTDFNPKSEIELIQKYRQIQQIPELDSAIEDIVSESIVIEDDRQPVSVNFICDDTEIPKNIKEIIIQEFENILSLLDIQNKGHDMFRQWYVDGRLYEHIIVDEANLSVGIKEIRNIDPRKIKKVREVTKRRNGANLEVVDHVEEYFVFNDSGINENMGIKLSPDTIAYIPSGILDPNNRVVSYLHKAIKPTNMLRMMEDATLIYQLTRAPERRVFYIDVSGMPKAKAEQYMKDTMNRYRNKVVYDSSTGELKDDRQHTSMLEDFWLPRTSNGRATEITTIQGQQITGQQEALAYYKNNLYGALNIPASRVLGDGPFNLGRSTEISRDEVKFAKFIARLRKKFSDIFNQLLRVQLVLKNIITPEDWDYIKSKIQYDFVKDNYFSELKDNEILTQRLQMVEMVQPLVGKVFSQEYVSKHILRLTDEQIDEQQKQIEIEMAEIAAQMKKSPERFQQDEDGNPVHPMVSSQG